LKHFETKYGYFSGDGNEYIIKTPKTPKPWINVISNGKYGMTISQAGGGFSWNEHSEFNRITRWHQDLIQDNWGKYLYFLDHKSGDIWSPGWMPARTKLDFYECRHGFGYTVISAEYNGIQVELTYFVPFEKQHEVWRLKIKNLTDKSRKLSVFSYFEWCLGGSNDHHREFHKSFLETHYKTELNGLIAKKRIWEIPHSKRGHWNTDYPYIGYHITTKKPVAFEGDKEKFLGQYGNLLEPEAIKQGKLSNTDGIWNDSIGSLQHDFFLSAGQGETVSYLLGIEEKEANIAQILNYYQTNDNVRQELKKVKKYWLSTMETIQVETPDMALNLMVNKWLKYQAISGRIWGRTAYYQQSGAFGFRDQLQDSQVFLTIDPAMTEKQIKLHARHQFENGRVLHWWHPITDDGLKNQINDNLLWLVFVTLSYLYETANYDFLNTQEHFYKSESKASIYDHCILALKAALKRRSNRGLPLIGGGDWNDGLSAVGVDNKGESVWLGHFMIYLLDRFSLVSEKMDDTENASLFKKEAENIRISVNENGWDGDWFLRATKDNGELLGSNSNDTAKIFLNAQTWSVMSDSTSPERQNQAMSNVSKYLLKDFGTLLLYPALNQPDEYIGYLSRYAPGARENGGVYTHAATWSIWAYSKLKQYKNGWQAFKRLNPIYNGLKPDNYCGEPYVTPGNIDGPDSAHYGRGGWTWYTGSAAWYQKVTVDWIIGVRATEQGLLIDPCIPKEWDKLKILRLFRNCSYDITIHNPDKKNGGVKKIIVDGNIIKSNILPILKKEKCRVDVYL